MIVIVMAQECSLLNCDSNFSTACVQHLLHVHQQMACVCVQGASFLQGLG